MLTRLLTTTALLLLALALPAAATPYNRDPGYAPEGRDGRRDNRPHFQQLRKGLDLTEAQARQVREIIADRRSQLAPLRERCRTDRSAWQQAFRHGDLKEAELRQLAHRQADCRVDRAVLHHAARERIGAVLTPEQRERWEGQRDRFPGRGNHRGWGAQRNFE